MPNKLHEISLVLLRMAEDLEAALSGPLPSPDPIPVSPDLELCSFCLEFQDRSCGEIFLDDFVCGFCDGKFIKYRERPNV